MVCKNHVSLFCLKSYSLVNLQATIKTSESSASKVYKKYSLKASLTEIMLKNSRVYFNIFFYKNTFFGLKVENINLKAQDYCRLTVNF